VDEVVGQVLDEIGIDLNSIMAEAPTGRGLATAAATPAATATDAEEARLRAQLEAL
jgi:division protein CdvB (Snf7/Vps24/ESCRT-III family)